MPEPRLTFRMVDEWPESDSPTPAVRFDANFPDELRDRAVLAELTDVEPDQPLTAIPPTIFRGIETVQYEVRLGPNLTVIRTRQVIRSTNRPPTDR